MTNSELKLAWRNIWRQKRRTLITAGAIAVALLLALVMRSMQEGSYAHNLDNATRFYSGYLQLQEPGDRSGLLEDLVLQAHSGLHGKLFGK